jgi:hypothetical protein
MSTASVFWDIEKGLLYHMTLRLAIQFIQIKIFVQLNRAYWLFSFTKKKFRLSVDGVMSTPRVMQTRVPQGAVLSPSLFSMYINDTHQTHVVHLALFTDETSLNAVDRKEGFVVRNLQRGLS